MNRGFGDRLRRTREERGLLQADLARRTGITQTSISNLEAGKRSPSTTSLTRLAGALGVSVQFLIGEDLSPLAEPELQVMMRDLQALEPGLRGVVKDTIHRLKVYQDAGARGVGTANEGSTRYGARRRPRSGGGPAAPRRRK